MFSVFGGVEDSARNCKCTRFLRRKSVEDRKIEVSGGWAPYLVPVLNSLPCRTPAA